MICFLIFISICEAVLYLQKQSDAHRASQLIGIEQVDSVHRTPLSTIGASDMNGRHIVFKPKVCVGVGVGQQFAMLPCSCILGYLLELLSHVSITRVSYDRHLPIYICRYKNANTYTHTYTYKYIHTCKYINIYRAPS